MSRRRRPIFRDGRKWRARARSTGYRTAQSTPIPSGNRPGYYDRLEWLRDRLGFPLTLHSLREDVKTFANHSGSPSYVDIPGYLNGRDGQGNGIGRRHCTTNYKVRANPPERPSSCGSASPPARPSSQDRWMTNRNPLIVP